MSNVSVPDQMRHTTARILGIAAASAFAVFTIFGAVTTCNADCNAASVKFEELYMRRLAECEQRQGPMSDVCARMQYQHCLDTLGPGRNVDSCKPLIPAAAAHTTR